MSVAVSLEELRTRTDEVGRDVFLITVGAGGPHVTSVAVRWEGDTLVAGAGRSTAANIDGSGRATLLWPVGRPDGEYSLIVDGRAETRAGAEGTEAVVQPGRAVLHRLHGAPGGGPTCITVAG